MILDKIVEKKRISLDIRKKYKSIDKLKCIISELRSCIEESSFKEALKKSGLSIIGEFKKASPSKGIIVEDFDIVRIEGYYKKLGVDCYSILTEEDFFLGSDDYIKTVRTLSEKPILRKDFIVDFYQLYEAKILGASAVLLIVAVLGDKLKDFYEECKKINLDALIEVHNKEELDIALECGGEIIGINNRDLKTFKTTLETTEKLIKYIPKGKIIISESGINTMSDLAKVRGWGVDAVLIGEMFMRNINNNEFIENYKRMNF